MTGMMVTHFSLGSLRSSHGLSISPFLIRLEWKYLGGCTAWTPVDEPYLDPGIEPYGEVKGFRGACEIGSLSGVPGLGVVVAVVVAVALC